MPKTITIKLNDKEAGMMAEMVLANEGHGAECSADCWRLLLWREWNRRHKKGIPHPSLWQGVYRHPGRPSKTPKAPQPATDNKV